MSNNSLQTNSGHLVEIKGAKLPSHYNRISIARKTGRECKDMGTDWIQLLATIVAAVVPFALYVTIGDRIKRERLWEVSLADLIAEIEQNLEHQKLLDGRWMLLEGDAYKLFGRRGLIMKLEVELRGDLRKLYSHVHQKNNRIKYYESYMTSGIITSISAEKLNDDLRLLRANIDEVMKEINSEIDKILPKLRQLRKGGQGAIDVET